MSELSITFPHPVTSIAAYDSKQSALAKLFPDRTPGIEVDIGELTPAQLMEVIRWGLESLIRAGVAPLAKEPDITFEAVQAKMRSNFDIWKSGAVKKAKRSGVDPVHAKARSLVRAALKSTIVARTGKEPEKEQLTKAVTGFFDAYKAFQAKNTPEETKAALKSQYGFVAGMYKKAREQLAAEAADQAAIAKSLSESGALQEAVAAAKAMAGKSPTEKVKAQKASAKKGGPAA